MPADHRRMRRKYYAAALGTIVPAGRQSPGAVAPVPPGTARPLSGGRRRARLRCINQGRLTAQLSRHRLRPVASPAKGVPEQPGPRVRTRTRMFDPGACPKKRASSFGLPRGTRRPAGGHRRATRPDRQPRHFPRSGSGRPPRSSVARGRGSIFLAAGGLDEPWDAALRGTVMLLAAGIVTGCCSGCAARRPRSGGRAPRAIDRLHTTGRPGPGPAGVQRGHPRGLETGLFLSARRLRLPVGPAGRTRRSRPARRVSPGCSGGRRGRRLLPR